MNLYLGGKGHYVTFATLYRRAVWTCPDGVVFLSMKVELVFFKKHATSPIIDVGHKVL
jgi:hypothetical protein